MMRAHTKRVGREKERRKRRMWVDYVVKKGKAKIFVLSSISVFLLMFATSVISCLFKRFIPTRAIKELCTPLPPSLYASFFSPCSLPIPASQKMDVMKSLHGFGRKNEFSASSPPWDQSSPSAPSRGVQGN